MKKFVLAAFAALGLAVATPMLAVAATPFSDSSAGVQGGSTG